MKEIQVEIIAEGMAKEVNALQRIATFYNGAACDNYLEWHEAERKRRVFKIVPALIPVYIEGYRQDNLYCPNNNPLIRVELGSIHTAEIINEKEVIIK